MEERLKEIDNLLQQCNAFRLRINENAIWNMNDGVNIVEEIPVSDSSWVKFADGIKTYFELYPDDQATTQYKDELTKLCFLNDVSNLYHVDGDRIDKIVGCIERLKNKVRVEQTRISRNRQSTTNEKVVAPNHTLNHTSDYGRVFIVHGHDGKLKAEVALLLAKQGIEPIILSEQVDQGKTIIEKIETYADAVNCAICLFTADDEMADGKKRARQNVVFEAGYFYGKIGRSRTIIIAENETMSFSDLQGVVYVDKRDWKLRLLRELLALGYSISLNNV